MTTPMSPASARRAVHASGNGSGGGGAEVPSFLQGFHRLTVPVRYLLGSPLVNLEILATKGGRAEAHAVVMRRAQLALRRCGVRVEVSGPTPAPGTGCVAVYNEASFADVAAFSAVMWRYVDRCGAAEAYGRVPFTKAACDRAGIVLVPRGNRAATERILTDMVDAARAGERVAWGGPGRLTGRDEVPRFKVGAALIALRAGVPLIPVAIRGGQSVLPLGSLRARPGCIRIRFGTPMSTAGLSNDDGRNLADRARDAVTALLAELPSGADPGLAP